MAQDEPSLEVVFGQAVNEQLDIIWRLNAKAWAGPLSLESYLERERFLSEQDLNKEGAWRTWALTVSGNPNEIVSSCETFEKKVWYYENNTMRPATAFGIASVYTNPRYRRKGMAALLLEKLKVWLDSDGEGKVKGVVSVLYSDIGLVCKNNSPLDVNDNNSFNRNIIPNLGGSHTHLIK